GPPVRPDSNLAERKVGIVIADDEILRPRAVGPAERGDRRPGEIHETLGPRDDHRLPRPARIGDESIPLEATLPAAVPPEKLLRGQEPDVVPRPFVAPAGVPEADDDSHLATALLLPAALVGLGRGLLGLRGGLLRALRRGALGRIPFGGRLGRLRLALLYNL